jgi:hypothetical protein
MDFPARAVFAGMPIMPFLVILTHFFSSISWAIQADYYVVIGKKVKKNMKIKSRNELYFKLTDNTIFGLKKVNLNTN